MNEGVSWLDAPVIVLLWVAMFACLAGISELRLTRDQWRLIPRPPRPLWFLVGAICFVIFWLALTAVLFGIYYRFGILFLIAPALAFPFIIVALAVWDPWGSMTIYQAVRAWLVLLVLSLLAASLWHATTGS